MSLASPETTIETQIEISKQEDKECAAQILDAYHMASQSADRARAESGNAVDAALRCGALLNSAKSRVGHGYWSAWLELYLPEVKQRTVQRWMQLAEKARKYPKEFGSPNSLRQAYIAVGVLSDPFENKRARTREVNGEARGFRADQDFIGLLHRLYSEKEAESMLSINDFSGWEHRDLELLERELTPLAALRERVKEALGWPGEPEIS